MHLLGHVRVVVEDLPGLVVHLEACNLLVSIQCVCVRERHTDRQRDRQADKLREREREREGDGWRERQSERKRETDRH